SRKHEIEADYMGMVFMKIAGYNPDAALSFWKKMSAGSSSKSDFFSTHPSDEKRIAEIKKGIEKINADK
ncbi:MAG: M48 family metalloprotease, partial [Muribaculaceae bacterium]|nr:M48 family metalloprotease [Muribaculaceae bacterium]